MLGLMAGGDTTSTSVQHGIEYLLEDAARRRKLGRRTGHRHRFPEGLLPELPLLPDYFPFLAAGDC